MVKFFFVICLGFLSLSAFAVPYARVSNGRLVYAHAAHKSLEPFWCFECKKELVLHKGKKRTHFQHKADPHSSCSGGGPETEEHQKAKQLLADHLDRWRFIKNCSSCGQRTGETTSFSALGGFRAKIESSFNVGAEQRRLQPDVTVFHGSEKIAAIEVLKTHAVGDEKRRILSEAGIQVFEVEADQIIDAHENGSFTALLTDQVQCGDCHAVCPACDSTMTRADLNRYTRCRNCNEAGKKWRTEVCQAIKGENVKLLRELMSSKPTHVVQPQYEADCLERKVEKIELKIAQKAEQERVEQQRRAQEWAALQHQLNQEREIRVSKKAEEIVRTNRIDLEVEFAENELAKKCGARWTGKGNYFWSEAKNIRNCQRWFTGDGDIILKVEELLMRTPEARKRNNQGEGAQPNKKSRTMLDFFPKR